MQIVTYSGHNPFILPEKLDNLKLAGDYDPVIRNYLTMAHYTDEALGILLEYLRSRPDYASTLIVITGDHEGLADYRKEATGHHNWVNGEQMTPFIAVNSPVGGRIEKTGGQADIYSTILQLMGLESYWWHGTGMSLLDPNHPGVALGSHAVHLTGDTTGIAPEIYNRLRAANRVSDLIIRHNLLSGHRH